MAAARDLARLELRPVESDEISAAGLALQADGLAEVGADDLVLRVEVDRLPEADKLMARGHIDDVAQSLTAKLLHPLRERLRLDDREVL